MTIGIMKSINIKSTGLAIILLSITGYADLALAAGQLMVAPTRIIFEARDRTAQVSLVNSGTEQETFRLEFVRKRMTQDGQFLDVDTPLEGELFSDQMIRFSPRQVTLPPGQSQTIRLILRKKANLQAGEYRSHLLFRTIPKTGSSSIESASNKDNKNLSIELTPALGISIPVIVRHGKTSADVNISNIKPLYDKRLKKQVVEFVLGRNGNESVYGDLSVNLIKSNGTTYNLARVNGISVYSPNKSRKIRMVVYPPKGVSIKDGKLVVVYAKPADAGGAIMAKGSSDL